MLSGRISLYEGKDTAVKSVFKLLQVCGVCSRHHVVYLCRHRVDPVQEAAEVLKRMRQQEYVDTWVRASDKPEVYRFSRAVREEYDAPLIQWNNGVDYRLAVTDLYLSLGQPDDFEAYPQLDFWSDGKNRILTPSAAVHGMIVELGVERWRRKRRIYEMYFEDVMWEMYFAKKPPVVILASDADDVTIDSSDGYELYIVQDMRDGD